MSMSSNLIGATTEMLLLALLRDRPGYGYELIKRAHRSSEGAVHWLEGSLYPVLRRLQSKELVSAKWHGPAVGRKRKVYMLTAKGRRALAIRTAEWRVFATGADTILRG